jgi:hypothetical protein
VIVSTAIQRCKVPALKIAPMAQIGQEIGNYRIIKAWVTQASATGVCFKGG